VVVAAGPVISGGYSLRPVRIADRGAAASLLLPAGYVAVPYLVGILGGRGSLRPGDLLLLGGLYVGFIGRIVLKDFRDVRGDALFGKRTFVIRHGRRRTCEFSAICWIAGSVALAAVTEPTLTLVGAWAVYLAVALWLLRALSVERGTRRDEALISAIAIVGRGMIVTLVAHSSMTGAGWPALAYLCVMGALVAVTLEQSSTMARRGPTTGLVVPSAWVTAVEGPSTSPPACRVERPAGGRRPVGRDAGISIGGGMGRIEAIGRTPSSL